MDASVMRTGKCSPEYLFPIVCGMAVVVATMAGCGPPATIVAGVVMVDGRPVEHAMLDFIPERGDAPTADARADGTGHYSVRVSAVPYRVTIRAQRATSEKKVVKPGEQAIEIVEDIVPPLYADPVKSPLRVEPTAQNRTIADFDISSKP